MASILNNIFTDEILNYIYELPEVKFARKQIDDRSSGKQDFTIKITQEIKDMLYNGLGLNITKDIPMRWIKGDTRLHRDRGINDFTNTYLVYLTDSDGEFIIGTDHYQISKNTGYVFNEGLQHETCGTNNIPRLLLGPMSEQGFPVGSGIYRPGGTTIYFRQTSDVEYSIDDQSSWISLGNNYPINIGNSDTSAGFLNVEFVSDIVLDNTYGGQYKYFICGTSYIKFGSSSLNIDGSRPVITIDGVSGYPGLIQNGTSSSNGIDHIYVFNLAVNVLNGSTLDTDKGWIGQDYFSKGVDKNFIINCSSNGPIIDGGGGIVGANSANNNGELIIIGCRSSGDISGTYAGGIVGLYANSNSTSGGISCKSCWSEGAITGNEAGGICGAYAGDNLVSIQNCYSTGNIIGLNSGGLVGSYANKVYFLSGNYSQGNISGNGSGGIVGSNATSNVQVGAGSGVYSTGNISINSGGIFGASPSATAFRSYVCGNLSGSTGQIYAGSSSIPSGCAYTSGWTSSSANLILQGTPNPDIGTTWVSTTLNQPYELLTMGYTPYFVNNIDMTDPENPYLINNYDSIITAGNSTIGGIISGKSYTILAISKSGIFDSYNTISINSISGIVSTTSNTSSGNYILYIRNNGSYNISTINLTVNNPSPPTPTELPWSPEYRLKFKVRRPLFI